VNDLALFQNITGNQAAAGLSMLWNDRFGAEHTNWIVDRYDLGWLYKSPRRRSASEIQGLLSRATWRRTANLL